MLHLDIDILKYMYVVRTVFSHATEKIQDNIDMMNIFVGR